MSKTSKRDSQKWKQTKEEREVSPNGEEIKRLTLEPYQRTILGIRIVDFIDLLVKSLGIIAIFIPVYLFYLQQKSEKDLIETQSRTQLYSKATTSLHTLLEKPVSDTESIQLQNTLFYELYPLLRLQGDKKVALKFAHIKNNIACYLDCFRFVKIVDEFRKFADSSRLQFIYKYYATSGTRNRHDSIYYNYLIGKTFDALNILRIEYRNFRAFNIEMNRLDTIGRSTVKSFAEENRKIIDEVLVTAETIFGHLTTYETYISKATKPPQIIRLPIEAELQLIHQLMDVEHYRFLNEYNWYLLEQIDILDSIMYLPNSP